MSRRASKWVAATSRDVAARAGVSPMTVSRALRKPELVSDATRERVERAAQALGYVPDLVAGALSSQRSEHVAVLVPSLSTVRVPDKRIGKAAAALIVDRIESDEAEIDARQDLGFELLHRASTGGRDAAATLAASPP